MTGELRSRVVAGLRDSLMSAAAARQARHESATDIPAPEVSQVLSDWGYTSPALQHAILNEISASETDAATDMLGLAVDATHARLGGQETAEASQRLETWLAHYQRGLAAHGLILPHVEAASRPDAIDLTMSIELPGGRRDRRREAQLPLQLCDHDMLGRALSLDLQVGQPVGPGITVADEPWLTDPNNPGAWTVILERAAKGKAKAQQFQVSIDLGMWTTTVQVRQLGQSGRRERAQVMDLRPAMRIMAGLEAVPTKPLPVFRFAHERVSDAFSVDQAALTGRAFVEAAHDEHGAVDDDAAQAAIARVLAVDPRARALLEQMGTGPDYEVGAASEAPVLALPGRNAAFVATVQTPGGRQLAVPLALREQVSDTATPNWTVELWGANNRSQIPHAHRHHSAEGLQVDTMLYGPCWVSVACPQDNPDGCVYVSVSPLAEPDNATVFAAEVIRDGELAATLRSGLDLVEVRTELVPPAVSGGLMAGVREAYDAMMPRFERDELLAVAASHLAELVDGVAEDLAGLAADGSELEGPDGSPVALHALLREWVGAAEPAASAGFPALRQALLDILLEQISAAPPTQRAAAEPIRVDVTALDGEASETLDSPTPEVFVQWVRTLLRKPMIYGEGADRVTRARFLGLFLREWRQQQNLTMPQVIQSIAQSAADAGLDAVTTIGRQHQVERGESQRSMAVLANLLLLARHLETQQSEGSDLVDPMQAMMAIALEGIDEVVGQRGTQDALRETGLREKVMPAALAHGVSREAYMLMAAAFAGDEGSRVLRRAAPVFADLLPPWVLAEARTEGEATPVLETQGVGLPLPLNDARSLSETPAALPTNVISIAGDNDELLGAFSVDLRHVPLAVHRGGVQTIVHSQRATQGAEVQLRRIDDGGDDAQARFRARVAIWDERAQAPRLATVVFSLDLAAAQGANVVPRDVDVQKLDRLDRSLPHDDIAGHLRRRFLQRSGTLQEKVWEISQEANVAPTVVRQIVAGQVEIHPDTLFDILSVAHALGAHRPVGRLLATRVDALAAADRHQRPMYCEASMLWQTLAQEREFDRSMRSLLLAWMRATNTPEVEIQRFELSTQGFADG